MEQIKKHLDGLLGVKYTTRRNNCGWFILTNLQACGYLLNIDRNKLEGWRISSLNKDDSLTQMLDEVLEIGTIEKINIIITKNQSNVGNHIALYLDGDVYEITESTGFRKVSWAYFLKYNNIARVYKTEKKYGT